ncbi:Fibronectin-binding protein [Streptococcus oralis]|uniref:Fibronectin-binding protein n=2 Tax=Streptococcus oralis TaxID=1303 RepID=A0A139RNI9_STROR|nr:Fibronectin-binding protein [Streptococcus oralis]
MGSEIQSDPLDVVLVADLSGSMKREDVQTASGSMVSRIQSLKNTLTGTNGRQGLIDSILSKPNNRLAIVGFGGKIDNQRAGYVSDSYSYYGYTYRYWPYWAGYYSGINIYDDANTILGWDSNASNAKYAADNMAIAGGNSLGNEAGIGTGTNITAGMQLANQLLGTARSNAKKVVILLSDGFANMYYDSNGYTIYNYDNQNGAETAPDWFERALNEETNKVSKEIAPKVDGFYSVKFRYSNSTDSISTLKSYISQYNNQIPNEIFSANDENQLQEQFKEITKKILPLGIHHVTITDILSKYVKLLPDNASHIRVVKVENGQEETLGADKVTLETKKNDAGLVEVTAKFNPDYILDDSVKYALKFRVTSTQEADDTSAGDKAVTTDDAEGGDATKLYSNKGAKVTYSYGKGSTQTKEVQYKEKPTFTPSAPLTIPVKVEWRGVNNVVNDYVTAPKPKQIDVKLVQKGKDGGQDKPNYRETTIPVTTGKSSFASVAKGYDYEVNPQDVPGFEKRYEKEEMALRSSTASYQPSS